MPFDFLFMAGRLRVPLDAGRLAMQVFFQIVRAGNFLAICEPRLNVRLLGICELLRQHSSSSQEVALERIDAERQTTLPPPSRL